MNNQYYHAYYRQAPPIQEKVSAPDFYISDDLFLNLGKKGDFHMSFPDSAKERDMVFHGYIYEATSDHIIVSNPTINEWYLLPLLYLNYVKFNEKPNSSSGSNS